MSTGTVHVEQCTREKLFTSLLIHVHIIISTGPAHVEELHAKKLATSLLIHVHVIMSTGTEHTKNVVYLIMLNKKGARGYEHGNGASGTVHMRKSGLLLYLFMCT
jgi:hypothetical protein